jgi:hypothetical protein
MRCGKPFKDTHIMTHLNNRFLAAGLFQRTFEPLSEEQLRAVAPSIFATERHESRSPKFQVIATIQVVRELEKEGFQAVAARQGRCRIAGKADYTKHMIRFRHRSTDPFANPEMVPEVILRNAADGTSAYHLTAGLFRPICYNGLVSANVIEDVRVGHTGRVTDRVVEGTYKVLDETTKVLEVAESWRGLRLSHDERHVMAEAAHTLRFADSDEPTRQAIAPERLLEPRRVEDDERDLWHTFNVVQENVVRGGMNAWVRRTNPETQEIRTRAMTVRPITSIDGDTALNKALWVLTQRMQELKSAA